MTVERAKQAGVLGPARELATKNEILRCLVGSTIHGLAIEGTDDRDGPREDRRLPDQGPS